MTRDASADCNRPNPDAEGYTDFLRDHEQRLSAPERFVLQRLEGLDRLAAWHPAS